MSDLDKKFEELETTKLDEELATRKASIAQKKALERQAKQELGPNWKKILGVVGKIKVNSEALHTMYGAGLGDLKEMSNPSSNFGRNR